MLLASSTNLSLRMVQDKHPHLGKCPTGQMSPATLPSQLRCVVIVLCCGVLSVKTNNFITSTLPGVYYIHYTDTLYITCYIN